MRSRFTVRKRSRPVIRSAPDPAPPAGVRTRARIAIVLGMFTVVFVALQCARATRQSATWDEPMHLTAGYAALSEGDFRVDPSHPPLVRFWAAIPLALAGRPLDTSVIDRTPAADWLPGGYTLARHFVSAGDIDRTLLASRAMVMMWGLALGMLVFAWAFEWMGLRGAVLALGLYAIEPNLAAHTALVTTDAAITALVFASVYFLWRYARGQSVWNLSAVAVATALAFITKFSAVLLAPLLVVLLAFAVRRQRIPLSRAAVVPLVTIAATIAAIWAAYGFRYMPSHNGEWLLTTEAFLGKTDTSAWGALFGWLDARRLLPNAYAQGLVFSLSSARELPAYLAGQISTDGWWYYFPLAVLLKTPVALLALSCAGVAMAIRHRDESTLASVFVVIPIAIWLIAAACSGVNLGVRHVLPIYPFLILAAGRAATHLLERRRPARVLLTVAMATLVFEVARSEPYPLSFFNTLAGGPANGFRYLADSNLGWGGNLKALKRWMDERGVDSINLAYFGSVDPATYGIGATYLPSSATFLADRVARPRLPGYVAISGTSLTGVFMPMWWQRFYAGFHELEPIAVVGNTMRIYWIERWPEPPDRHADGDSLHTLADGLLFGLGWPEHALVHYDEYLRDEPRDPQAWNARSLALARTGRPVDALEGFRRVLAFSPADPDARRNVAILEQQLGLASRAQR